MSADVDPEDQTEEPTEKRLHDATERGEVAFSREAPLFASLSATLIALIFVIPGRAVILLIAAGVLASVAQSAPRIVPERIMPDPSRISLRKGFRRLLGARGWTE